MRLCNCVIGHDMLPFKNFNFPSFWKGWNKWSDCLWPSKGKWNKNSWVGQEGDESCYTQLIRKGQRSGLQELGQLSGSKTIASVLDSYPNPLKWIWFLQRQSQVEVSRKLVIFCWKYLTKVEKKLLLMQRSVERVNPLFENVGCCLKTWEVLVELSQQNPN